MKMPDAIAAMVGQAEGIANEIGKSQAVVRMYPDHVLKIRPESRAAVLEVSILKWLGDMELPVPGVAAHTVSNGQDWLLMTRMHGTILCDPSVMDRPSLLLDCLAEGFHRLWAVDAAECPFERTLSDELDAAEACIRAGRFDASDCDPATFGPGGFRDPATLLEWLRTNAPSEKRVLSHGDYCLPNLLTDGRHLSGMIDLGDCGVADPWRDLSLGWRSLKHNSDGHWGHVYPNIDPDDLFRAVGIAKDAERLRYYLLLDELF